MSANWKPTSELPPWDQRPGRHFIRVEGWKQHSGSCWHRLHFDVAWIRRDDLPDSVLGYRREDMDRIMRDGDMDGIDAVTHWAPADFGWKEP